MLTKHIGNGVLAYCLVGKKRVRIEIVVKKTNIYQFSGPIFLLIKKYKNH